MTSNEMSSGLAESAAPRLVMTWRGFIAALLAGTAITVVPMRLGAGTPAPWVPEIDHWYHIRIERCPMGPNTFIDGVLQRHSINFDPVGNWIFSLSDLATPEPTISIVGATVGEFQVAESFPVECWCKFNKLVSFPRVPTVVSSNDALQWRDAPRRENGTVPAWGTSNNF